MVKPRKNLEHLEEIVCHHTDKQWRLKLDENENIYGVPDFIKSTIRNADFDEISKFPNPKKFIEKLSEKYDISKNNIILSMVFSNLLNSIFNAYLENEDEIISFSDT